MKPILSLAVPLALMFTGVGCTTFSLEHRTTNQSLSATTYRYEATLHCLAMVAANRGTLPSYALLSNGSAQVSDTGIASPTTVWGGAPILFTTETLGFTLSRSPQQQWTVDPVADYTQLEAMRSACNWVLAGQDRNHFDPILADAEDAVVDDSPGVHPRFGVIRRLASLPDAWLHWGGLRDIPACARYKAHYGDTWVWVTPDGMEGLAGFTLVLQDIATLVVAPPDNSPPANITPPVLVTLWSVRTTLPKADTVIINIERDGDNVVYRQDGKSDQAIVEVTVGQYVIWRNSDSDRKSTHSATSQIPNLFDTDAIPNGASSKAILFDDSTYTAAGGYTIEDGRLPITINYADKGQPKTKSQIRLRPNPNKSLYSPTLVFREDRMIKPQYLTTIEERIQNGIQSQRIGQPQFVEITWKEWQEWTTPFQGQRTAAKPGAPQQIPVLQPSTRLRSPGAALEPQPQPFIASTPATPVTNPTPGPKP